MELSSRITLAFHVFAVVLWIGATAAMATVVRVKGVDAKARQSIAVALYKGSYVGLVLAVVLGVVQLVRGWKGGYLTDDGVWIAGYSKSPWMHMKLTAVVVILGLHGFGGARLRKSKDLDRDGKTLSVIFGISVALALVAIFLVIVRPLSPAAPR